MHDELLLFEFVFEVDGHFLEELFAEGFFGRADFKLGIGAFDGGGPGFELVLKGGNLILESGKLFLVIGFQGRNLFLIVCFELLNRLVIILQRIGIGSILSRVQEVFKPLEEFLFHGVVV